MDVKFIVNKMPPKVRAFFDLLRYLFILLFSAYMVYCGYKIFGSNLNRYATGTKIPLAVGYASIIFGYFSGAVRSFWTIISRLFRRGEDQK